MAKPSFLEDDFSDDDEEESFEDAFDIMQISGTIDMDKGVEGCKYATNLFWQNKFSESRANYEPWIEKSFYHALGYATIMSLQAVMTFDFADIDNANKAVKQAVDICSKYRKRTSFLSRGKTNYDKLLREEIHAEICYAELGILRALLLFIQDENLISFVKGSLKIRSCYQSYKECVRILEKRKWKPDDHKEDFQSGVHLGVGMFNLMISLLPAKIMKLLEFAGFSGKKRKGLAMLQEGADMEDSVRAPLCSLSLLGYHTVIAYVLGTADGDMVVADREIKKLLTKYPKGALFLFFAGKVNQIKGNVPDAILRFEESVDSQSEWRQFHHLCFWELMWCHSFLGDWLLAMKYAEKLAKESRWSKATYTYQKAAFLMMCDDQTEDTRAHLKFLLSEVPRLRIRIAGKSLPFEKFAVKKAKRFSDQNGRLTLPGYELIYIWNGFAMIGQNKKLLEPVVKHIEKEMKTIEANKAQYKLYEDDMCLAMLLKGVTMRYLGKFTEAEQCLLYVSSHEKEIKQDNYLVPYAMTELGLLNIVKDDLDTASSFLDMAKQQHRYSMESRLHFRIHAAKLKIRYMSGLTEEDSALSDLSSPELSSQKKHQLEKELEEENDDDGITTEM